MLKLANQVVDAYDDVTKESLVKIAKKNPSCYMLSDEERSKLGDHDFALSIITKTASKMNKFPVNSSDSAWLSSEYFDANCHKLPHEAAKIAAWHIKSACAKFKLPSKLSVDSYAAMLKTAESNVYYERDGDVKGTQVIIRPDLTKIAEVQKIGDNYTAAQYAFASPAHVKVACEYFAMNLSKIPLEQRHKYAAAIQRRAHELGMEVQKGEVQKYASDYYSPMVDAHIRARASLLEGKPELKSTVEKIGSAKKNYTPSQFAQLLYGFDKQAGLSRYYGAGLTDPFQATFAGEPDPYAGYRTKVGSATVSGDDLQKVVNAKYSQIKEHFGPHLADELRKHPTDIFESLPRDAKEIIVGIIDGTH